MNSVDISQSFVLPKIWELFMLTALTTIGMSFLGDKGGKLYGCKGLLIFDWHIKSESVSGFIDCQSAASLTSSSSSVDSSLISSSSYKLASTQFMSTWSSFDNSQQSPAV